MIEQPQFKIVIGVMEDQQGTSRETAPHLLPAILYSDHVTVVTAEDDTLIELADFHDILAEFGGNNGTAVMDYFGYDDPLPSNVEQDNDGASRDYEMPYWREGESFEEYKERYAIDEAHGIMSTVERMLDDSNVMPLIYDPHGRLAQNVHALGRMATGGNIKKQAGARLGTELIVRLPSFSALGPTEIAELRKKLSGELVPFRSYVAEASSAVAEVGYDTDALADVINEIYVGKVIPAVNELERQTKDNGFLRRLLHDFGRDPKTFVQSFLTLGIGEVTSLPLYVSIGAAIGTQLIGEAAKMHDEGKRIGASRLHVLYETERAGKSISLKAKRKIE